MSFLLNPIEAAKYLNISQTDLWRITNVEKKIKGYPMGNSIKYNIKDLNNYLGSEIIGNPVKYAQESLNEDIAVKGVLVNTSG